MLSLSGAALAQEVPVTTEEGSSFNTLPMLVINGQETANLRPATTYASPISNLEFDPRVDLQSRNMAEAQGDISIRGGIFENTGIQVGAATITDPQTGHYFTELPIAPEMLDGPRVLTGADNALSGFNSSVGTLSYGWSVMQDGGSATVGGGDNNLNFQRIHNAFTGGFTNSEDWSWGVEAEYSRSESDGTIKYGDHDFDRTTGRVQLLGPNSQTDFFAGYQSKFFGWPGMYTGDIFSIYDPYETENIKTRLFMVNHQHDYGTNNTFEVSAYARRNSDEYQFNRFKPDKRFVHETKNYALALSGRHELNDSFALNHSTQLTTDEIDSTNLEEGDFTSRTYYKFSLLPEYKITLDEGETITTRAGATLDDTNRDSSEVSPIFDITWLRKGSNGHSESIYVSYAEATQVAGYGAVGGKTDSGLFRSNPDLDRETSQNLELGGKIKRDAWSFEGAIFYRWDDDLVDWTYSDGNLFAREANAVDIETFGVEIIGTRRWENFEGIASYTYLHKDEDYGSNDIDASFYALNFPEHRATLGVIWNPNELFQVRVDNEWRDQKTNSLRSGSNDAIFTLISASYYPSQIEGLECFAAFDKPWDDDFQELPGTPGRSDQFSVGATYRW
jgi:vitamin B12 transporter